MAVWQPFETTSRKGFLLYEEVDPGDDWAARAYEGKIYIAGGETETFHVMVDILLPQIFEFYHPIPSSENRKLIRQFLPPVPTRI